MVTTATPEDEGRARAGSVESIERERAVRDRLTGALDGLGGVVGGIIRGAPQAFAPIINAVPGLQRFGAMMGFAEGYIDVWRQLTDRGVNFGNKLDEMIIRVGQANLQMQDFMRIINENNGALMAQGGIANRGVDVFLQQQTAFMELGGEMEELRSRLNLLGMTSTDIAERFIEFDRIAAMQGLRSRFDTRERNRAATEFAETLDELSRLTGKQVDALAEEMAEVARDPQVFAFGQMIDERVRDELRDGLTGMGQISPEFLNYAKDMISRGTPNPDDPEMLVIHAFARETGAALLAARQALLDGNEELADEYFRQALEAGRQEALMRDQARLVALGGITDITRAMGNVVGSALESDFVLAGEAIERFARDMFGEDYTGTAEQLARATERMLELDRAGQLEGEDTPGRDVLEQYLRQLRNVEGVAAQAQQFAVNQAFAGVQSALDAVAAQIGTINLNDAVNNALAEAIGVGTAIALGLGTEAQIQNEADRVTTTLSGIADSIAATDVDAANRVRQLITDLEVAAQNLQRDPENMEYRLAFDDALRAAGAVIESNRDVFVNGQTVNVLGFDMTALNTIFEGILSRLNLNVGTMGRMGSLFHDFGTETPVNLHGIEAVVTPDQMAAIVQNSALGALRASAIMLEEGASRNSTNVLNGMLNTIRTMPEQLAQATDGNEFNNVMSSLPSQLRVPLEEAMNNTLVPRIEQLISTAQAQLDHSDRIRRGIGNLSPDMLRSA